MTLLERLNELSSLLGVTQTYTDEDDIAFSLLDQAMDLVNEIALEFCTIQKSYVIVENAGYEGENEFDELPTLEAAVTRMRYAYDNDELERLHVRIAKRMPDGSLTYEY